MYYGNLPAGEKQEVNSSNSWRKFPWIFSYHNWQGTFFQFYSTKVRVMREQAIPIFPLPKAPAKQLFSPDLVRELWETMKVQDVSNS